MRRLRNQGANNFSKQVGEELGVAGGYCTIDDVFENLTPLGGDVPVANGREEVQDGVMKYPLHIYMQAHAG